MRAISAGEWGAVVGVSPLSGWRETLCVVLTYGGEGKRGLCGRLGDRLNNAGLFLYSFRFCFILLFAFAFAFFFFFFSFFLLLTFFLSLRKQESCQLLLHLCR